MSAADSTAADASAAADARPHREHLSVVLFGATGMIGSGVLQQCLADARVREVLLIGRTGSGVTHPKVQELVRHDLFHYDDVRANLAERDACFFCAGVSAVGMDEASYTRITLDLTVAAAEAVGEASPGVRFCYVSGAGTDSSEGGRAMWARVKGRTENRLLDMPGLDAYMFRPAFIQPMKGVRSKTRLYRWFYALTGPLYPVLGALLPGQVTSSERLGRAMIAVAARGHGKRVLETRDINEAAAGEGH
jgi:nucleoside-diphosphate-sugar epimerase